jgi:hypothetical protein
MRWRDAKGWSAVSHAARSSHSREEEVTRATSCESGERPEMTAPSRLYPSISTERIMQAVEQQRRISQQLEDLRLQQKQRTAFLRTTGLKCIALLCGVLAVLGSVFVFLLFARPDLLERVLDTLSGAIAWFFALGDSARQELTQIPLNSWLLSGAALLVVLMMGLWVRLMRYPREA